MARTTGPKCKLCRREGMKLFLKGSRCETVKCGLAKKEYAPGQHTWRRRSKVSEYATHLREKQKVKRYYGVFERQFRRYFDLAERQKGNTGENLLILLERRLDNAVFCAGFGLSRASARQLIRHGHIAVNGRKVNVPSFSVRPGDVITPLHAAQDAPLIKGNLELSRGRTIPPWLEVQDEPPAISVASLPTREQVELEVEELLVVEFCSR